MSIKIKPGHSLFLVSFTLLLTLSSACSVRRYAVNMVGDALASGNSVYESEEDIDLHLNFAVFLSRGWGALPNSPCRTTQIRF